MRSRRGAMCSKKRAQVAHAIGPPHDEGVERDREHQGLRLALGQHFVEAVDQHVHELTRSVAVPDDAAGIVALDRIGHRQDAARARVVIQMGWSSQVQSMK